MPQKKRMRFLHWKAAVKVPGGGLKSVTRGAREEFGKKGLKKGLHMARAFNGDVICHRRNTWADKRRGRPAKSDASGRWGEKRERQRE